MQAARQNAGVRGLAALRRGEGHDLDRGQAHGVRRGQVVGHEHDALVRGAQRFGVAAHKARLDAFGHGAHVLHAFADVRVLDGGERGGNGLHSLVQRPFGADVMVADALRGGADKLGVLADHHVRIDDRGVVAQFGGYVVTGAGKVVAHVAGGLLKAGHLRIRRTGRNDFERDASAAAVGEERLADGNARRNGYALQDLARHRLLLSKTVAEQGGKVLQRVSRIGPHPAQGKARTLGGGQGQDVQNALGVHFHAIHGKKELRAELLRFLGQAGGRSGVQALVVGHAHRHGKSFLRLFDGFLHVVYPVGYSVGMVRDAGGVQKCCQGLFPN
ncbi:hypothetical protein DSECCO2_657340 [anaerobic digester metagenome]